ncbi:MAG: coproporphyrinogen III oxidase family protein [Sphaerochaetaceae bacterium]|nr:coproporphyrinogen III oxidase family protein [Sphaerochaetaceae bacterium]
MDFLNSFDYNKEISLYIHVPFCTSKCKYCAFYSKTDYNDDVLDLYLNRIIIEINEVTKRCNRPYYTAFIGGGNPGILGYKRLSAIVDAVCEKGQPREFSLEINPETLNVSMFSLFSKNRKTGHFTRISLGVQSLNRRALFFLGRNATLEETYEGLFNVMSLRNSTSCTVNLDLITCLGSWHDSLQDINRILSNYDPDSLSLYALTLEEGTPLYKEKPVLPDGDGQYDILFPIWKYLEDSGYNHYEVSNFGKKGKECLHNKVYWQYKQYLGLGPGAASTAFGINTVRFDFLKDINSYIHNEPFTSFSYEVLDKTSSLYEFVLMGLRSKEGLDVNRLKKDFSKSLNPSFFNIFPNYYELSSDGFLVPDDNGLMIADTIAEELLTGSRCPLL